MRERERKRGIERERERRGGRAHHEANKTLSQLSAHITFGLELMAETKLNHKTPNPCHDYRPKVPHPSPVPVGCIMRKSLHLRSESVVLKRRWWSIGMRRRGWRRGVCVFLCVCVCVVVVVMVV